MVPFAGYDMPVQYATGVLREHLHTRASAGLFDVSHMGQIALRPKSGKVEDAALALERLVPQDILARCAGPAALRAVHQCRRRHSRRSDGGEFRQPSVSGGQRRLQGRGRGASARQPVGCLRDRAAADRALIALQGPKAESVLAKFCADAPAMRFMDAGPRRVDGIDCFVSRSGYTGEDGFEISVPAEQAEALATALLANSDVLPIGLGARDSLRLEAGLCLYGHDIDTTTTPVEGALEWSIQKSRRNGGARAGGFPGADTDSAAARARRAAPPRRLEARGPRAGARRRAAVRGCDFIRADRRGHLGRLWPQPQCARRDGLSAVVARRVRRRWYSPNCADSACRCGSRRCPSFPTPTNAELANAEEDLS